jgi:hypothetical protein
MVYESLSNCGEIEIKRIEEGLQSLKSCMVRRQHEWNPQSDWLTNAEAEHIRRPFHAILARANPNQREFVLEGDAVSETHPLWDASTSCVIPRKAHEMAVCIALLLQSCHEILFIDPYFRPYDIRHRRPLEAFLAVIEKRQSVSPTRIEIHTGNNTSADYFRDVCERCLPSIVPQGIQVRII